MKVEGACLLIVFVKNLKPGRVKTRIAKTMGNEKALEVYNCLLDHTFAITKELACDKVVYYSDEIEHLDYWQQAHFSQELQQGRDLGEKMFNAFARGFQQGYKKVVLIGSDCMELNQALLEKSFNMLDEKEACIGPARDGGYYLIGLKTLYPELFLNKQWSTNTVLKETVESLEVLSLSVNFLPELADIDEEKDWIRHQKTNATL